MKVRKDYIKIPVQPLLSAIIAENKTVESVLRNINVNEDYVTDFPTDDLGKKINKDLNLHTQKNQMTTLVITNVVSLSKKPTQI